MSESRFRCPSAGLSLRSLLKRTRHVFWIGLAFALGIHLISTQLGGPSGEQSIGKPLTTRFIKRQPRLTKPLEMKRRPQPKRRRMQRRMVSVKAKVKRQQITSQIQVLQVMRSLARPRTRVGRFLMEGGARMEPKTIAEQVAGSMNPESLVDMSLEMVDIDALDTGQYQAMVIQDPIDKQNIKGYLHLAMAYPVSVSEWDLQSGGAMIRTLRRLIDKLNEWTDIKASVSARVSFDSQEFFKTPWVYLFVGERMEPTQSEIENLGKYLLNGGFFFFEGHLIGRFQGERHLMRFVKLALASQGYRQGADWEYQFLSNDHPIFHCYYDLPGGSPPAHVLYMAHNGWGARDDGVQPWSRGIEIDARMVALNTNQLYTAPWGVWGLPRNPAYAEYDPTPQLRFGINTIIFALTQEGSITRRLMGGIR